MERAMNIIAELLPPEVGGRAGLGPLEGQFRKAIPLFQKHHLPCVFSI